MHWSAWLHFARFEQLLKLFSSEVGVTNQTWRLNVVCHISTQFFTDIDYVPVLCMTRGLADPFWCIRVGSLGHTGNTLSKGGSSCRRCRLSIGGIPRWINSKGIFTPHFAYVTTTMTLNMDLFGFTLWIYSCPLWRFSVKFWTELDQLKLKGKYIL